MSENFAVIRLNSKQYIVRKGDKLKIDRVSEGASIEVLLADFEGDLMIGSPVVEGIALDLEVIEDRKDKKLEVRRYKSKSRYRKHKGHRQPISVIHIADFGPNVKNEVIRVELIAMPNEEGEKEEKKVEKKESKSVQDLDITDRMKKSLIAAGYKTADDVKKASKEDLESIKGFGAKSIEKLLKQIG